MKRLGPTSRDARQTAGKSPIIAPLFTATMAGSLYLRLQVRGLLPRRHCVQAHPGRPHYPRRTKDRKATKRPERQSHVPGCP